MMIGMNEAMLVYKSKHSVDPARTTPVTLPCAPALKNSKELAYTKYTGTYPKKQEAMLL